jgi:hypothetical protein
MMPKIRFRGRVMPRMAKVHHEMGHKLRWFITPTSEATLDLTITNGRIDVECECREDIDNETLTALYIRSLDFSKVIVDMISFSTGMGFTVVLDQYISPTGGMSEMLPQDSAVVPLCTAFSIDNGEEFEKIYRIVISDPAIFMALNDLIVAISSPHAAPVNCYRAVEGIRHLIAPGLEPVDQWPLMNEALRISKTYVNVIRENATQQRHGNRLPVPGPTVRQLVSKSWVIMNRFLEYKKRGAIPLPQSEFPTLM